MKKIIICILSIMLICVNVSSVSAASDNAIKVSLENIEDIMIDNSSDMKIAYNNLKNAKEEYEEFNDNFDSELDKREENVDNLKDELEESNEEKNSDGQTGNDNSEKQNPNKKDSSKRDKSDIKKELKDSKKELRNFKNRKKESKYNLKLAKLQYDQIVKQKVISAQKQYLEYLNTLSKKEIAKKDLDLNNKDSFVFKMKYEKGFISEKEYNSHITNNTHNDTFEELCKKQETDLKNLHMVLGISYTTEIIFDNDIDIDTNKVSNINFKDDLNEMFENNIDIQIKDIELDKVDLSDNEYTIDNAEILLKQEKDNAKLDFEKQYNELVNSCNIVKSKTIKLNDKKNDTEIMKTKYNYGFVSQRQVEDLELEFNKQKSEFLSDKNNFYVNYLEYIQMKEGY